MTVSLPSRRSQTCLTPRGAASTFEFEVRMPSVTRANGYETTAHDAVAKYAYVCMCHMCLWSPKGGGRVT